jgi:type I restriction enzyme S subunit
MSKVIPEGWCSLTLEEFSLVNMGQSPKGQYVNATGDGIPFYQGKTEFGKLYPTPRKNCTIPTKLAENGDILLSVRAPVGPTNLCQETSCIGRGLAGIRAYIEESQPFLHHFFRNIEPWLSQQGTGTTFKAVSGGFLKDISVCAPPLAEQKVIADKLDDLLAQVESTKARLDAIPAILKSFRQSVLTAAVSGKLTEEWREVDSTSQEMSIDNVCHTGFDGPFGSKLKTADYTNSGVRVARLENVGHLNFIEEKQTFISEKKHQELTRNTLEENDILFSSFVEEEVRVCLFPKHHSTFINKADCFCLRVNDKVALPKFVAYVLASRSSYEQIKSNVQGVTRPRINLKILKSLTFRFPKLNEQAEIVRRVEELFAFADKVEAQVNAAQLRVNNLTQSILAKAFRGELTADWRTANPELISGHNSAEALLKRIKAEREALATKKKPTKKPRVKKATT